MSDPVPETDGYEHDLRLVIRRRTMVHEFGRYDADSEVDVSTRSCDLIAGWRELLSRLPNDVHDALKLAMIAEAETR